MAARRGSKSSRLPRASSSTRLLPRIIPSVGAATAAHCGCARLKSGFHRADDDRSPPGVPRQGARACCADHDRSPRARFVDARGRSLPSRLRLRDDPRRVWRRRCFCSLPVSPLVLSAESKFRKTGDFSSAWRAVQKRGWQVFGLAFLFRLQSYILSGGYSAVSLLKVDILNVMGPAIAMAAIAGGTREHEARACCPVRCLRRWR